ncbi:MAG TPA: MASE1 domain-containing protein [Candidatus Eisenbacteria bacterium]|nr:MASE1 domain-containing protein [Candidatus Eisenbacteria bacterium]
MTGSRFYHNQPHLDSRTTWLVVCATVALSYFVPKLIGVLDSNPQTVWPLWPGCAILVTGLLLVRVSIWPLLIPASFIGFALADLQAGVSLSSVVQFIPGNTLEVLISAIGLRYCFDGLPRLNSIRALIKYSLFALVLAPCAGAFLSARSVSHDYSRGWKIVLLSEMLAFITVTPALLSWLTEGSALMRKSRALHLEGLLLIVGLVVVSYVVFTLPEDSRSPALFYSLLPFLLWSALRFGWLGASTSLITVSFLSVWGAVHGRGPFSNMVPLTDPLPLQMFLVFASITFMVLAAVAEEHEQDAQAVRESEGRFRLVANTAPIMIWMAGPDKLCNYFNQPWLQFTGVPIQAQLGNGWAEGVHTEDLQHCLQTYAHAFDQRQRFEMEYRLRRHDGEYRWVLDAGVPRFNTDRTFAGYIGCCLDITDRKLAEEALGSIGQRLIEAHEEERTWIARELHDDIAQRIALLAVELERCTPQASDSMDDLNESLQLARQRISDLGKDIQALSHRLHSSKLEYLGLPTAAKSFCRELAEQRKVQIEFIHTDIPADIPREVSLCLFRVLQEALQNAIKHSSDQNFTVEMRGSKDGISLTVTDEGIGFDWQDAMNRRGLGLISMRERLRLVNGQLSIRSSQGIGTTIVARVPLAQTQHSISIAG